MKDRVRLPLAFDPESLQNDLRHLANSQWIDHFVRENYEGDWTVIPLRGPRDATHPVKMIYSDPCCTDFSDTPFLENLDYYTQVLARFECPLDAVRLMKLTAGSRILEHRDLGLDADSGTARLHIPVQTNPLVDFRLNGSRVSMQPGECWYLRLSDPHSVENPADTDRVHLVIDAQVNDWLCELLESDSPESEPATEQPSREKR